MHSAINIQKLYIKKQDKAKHFWRTYLCWNYRITESQNGRGWKGPLWVI